METRLLENNKEKEKLSFLVKGTNPAFVNTLRYIMINKVPTLAIEDVEFSKNNSVLYDEIVAHRLGLVPIKTDLRSYDLPGDCNCKGSGCAKCSLKLSLSATGPGIVYTAKIKSKDPKAVPTSQKMPIVKLLKEQVLQLEAVAILGKGEEHAKWSPCLAYYKYKPDIEIAKNPKEPKKVADSCPVDVFNVKEDNLVINKDNLLKCHLCGACVESSNGAVNLAESGDDFIFYIDSWGQLDCREIVTEATNIFQKDLDEFTKELKKQKASAK